jgi:hypothetical protein
MILDLNTEYATKTGLLTAVQTKKHGLEIFIIIRFTIDGFETLRSANSRGMILTMLNKELTR